MGNTETKPNVKKIAKESTTITGILVVDDVRIMYDIIYKYFKHYYQYDLLIKYAQNGYQAIDVLKEYPDINVVLMDIKMSPIDGYETTRRILKTSFNGIVLGVSGMVDEESIKESFKAGMADVCSKPIIYDVLIEKLNSFNYHLPKQL